MDLQVEFQLRQVQVAFHCILEQMQLQWRWPQLQQQLQVLFQ
jgi:hypothetical protein